MSVSSENLLENCMYVEVLVSLCAEQVFLGGVMASVLETGPKVRGFKPGRGDEFLRAIQIRRMPYFGVEVNQKASYRKI
jgi:hypothetical protein